MPLFPYPDGFFSVSLKSILLTVLDGCILPACKRVSVLNMVGNFRFILFPSDRSFSLGPRDLKAFSDAFSASVLCSFNLVPKRREVSPM